MEIWEPIHKPVLITRLDGNILQQIDGLGKVKYFTCGLGVEFKLKDGSFLRYYIERLDTRLRYGDEINPANGKVWCYKNGNDLIAHWQDEIDD